MFRTGYIILFASALLLGSCFKKEDPVILPHGQSEITTLFLGENYEKDLFFDLSTNSYSERQSSEWDLRFESGKNGWGVFVNNGTNIIVRKINVSGLHENLANDTNHFKAQKELVDAPDGHAESSAIGDWRTYRSSPPALEPGIYVIELSYLTGSDRFKRLQVLDVNDSAFFIRITSIGEIKTDTTILKKDKDRNFTYWSFKNGGHIVPNAEPDKHTWDIVFTRYKHIFYDILPGNEPFPYRVVGALSSPYKVCVARDSMDHYGVIDAGSILNMDFSYDQNAIGYDWKTHAYGATGNYTVNPKITFVIKDTDGMYFKLRFLDFYSPRGDKGYPKFEFERIK